MEPGKPVGMKGSTLITWFRLFRWWGSEAMRTVFRWKEPAQASVLVPANPYVHADWVFTEGKTYALVAPRGKRRITIHHLPEMGRN